jgi:hypothetical protein
LQLVLALQSAAQMEESLGTKDLARGYRLMAARIQKALLAQCWDEGHGLISDTPVKDKFSQHANVLAILTGAIAGEKARLVGERLLKTEGLAQATYYFRFYLHRALQQVGLGDHYLEWLDPWRNMLSLGLTTWAEEPEPARSDCHAWSAHPNVDLLATIAGIEPAARCYSKVLVAPHLGPLDWVEAVVPHPRGEIRARFRREGNGIRGTVVLPEGITGTFRHGGTVHSLRSGEQSVSA